MLISINIIKLLGNLIYDIFHDFSLKLHFKTDILSARNLQNWEKYINFH